jgi:hypothetical protein
MTGDHWLPLLMDALDEAHGEHSNDPCDCYERLSAAIVDRVYRFPEVSHDVPLPPTFGCETLMTYTMRRMLGRTEDAFYRDVKLLVDLPYDASKAPIGRKWLP